MTVKLERERALLRAVYDESKYAEVEHQDSPDFVLRLDQYDPGFGVEITEVFETDADARLERHPEYIGQLFAGGRHMHREDKKILAVSKVSIRSPDGTVRATEVPAIIRQRPTVRQRYEAVARRLSEKQSKFVRYSAGLRHVNLILADQFGDPTEFDDDGRYVIDDVLVPELRRAVLHCGFREVFLVSATTQNNVFFRPLRMLLLIEAFYKFCWACADYPPLLEGGADFQLDELVPLFVELQRTTDLPVDLSAASGGGYSASYRGTAVTVTDDGHITVLDLRDLPTSPVVPAPPLCLGGPALREFESFHENYKLKNQFRCGVTMGHPGGQVEAKSIDDA